MDKLPADGSDAPPMIDIPNAMIGHGILSGGPPSEAALRQAIDAGYKTIINLRAESEPGVDAERVLAAELGFHYVAIPVAGPAGLTSENAAALDWALETSPRPIMVHCGAGNRVGALMAIRAHNHQNLSIDDAIQVGYATGMTTLEPAVRRQLEG